jgi:hypothetical protein
MTEAAMETLITRHREGFGPGYTAITSAGEPGDETGISMGVLRLAAGETHAATLSQETAFLLMEGRIAGHVGGISFDLARGSLFDESPACLHAPAGAALEIRATEGAELTVYACENPATFTPRVFASGDVADERRGEGQVGGRCLRLVRTIFDARNSPAEVRLVLGGSSPSPAAGRVIRRTTIRSPRSITTASRIRKASGMQNMAKTCSRCDSTTRSASAPAGTMPRSLRRATACITPG